MNFLRLSFVLLVKINLIFSEDFYELLGISRNADNREIRKAFKKLALKLHPDKNDEEGAHEKFLKLTRAYEVLKDEDLRKKYDVHGEDGINNSGGGGGGYQSWNYYHEDFGIYDDDIEIVTLDYGEFQRSVMESHNIWFINFYSPRCGHCHDLAPTWRRIAKQLQGVIRIGAVNCQDEFMLCRRQGITGYPSLNLFTMEEGTKKYTGRREEDDIMDYVSRFLPSSVIELWTGNYKKWLGNEDTGSRPWLLIFCSEETGCPDTLTRKLVGASLQGLVSVGLIDCDQDVDLCRKFGVGGEPSLVYFPGNPETEEGLPVPASMFEHRAISRAVLELVPGPTELDDESFSELRARLEKDVGPGWLVQFTGPQPDPNSLEYKKLVHLVPRLRVGKLDCAESSGTCRALFITKYPTFVVFKVGGGYEISYGKTGVQDIATFARIASQARTLKTLTSDDFPQIFTSGGMVFIDFFAPWCPPCMRLLPEFRKASSLIGGQITFGTLDCSIHYRLCTQHGVRAYPTSIFYNGSSQHEYAGDHEAEAMADFVQDILRPSVLTLTAENFQSLVGGKTGEEMWLVDFYSPWCGPCKQLEPHWSNLGRKLEKLPHVKVGKVNCQVESDLCDRQAVRSYPTIRMYPLDSIGSRKYQLYQDYQRDVDSLYKWVQSSLPSNVEALTPYSFQHSVLRSKKPWLVEFYAPLCGHCVRFAPQFEQIATVLKGKAKVGKVNCERYRQLCIQADVSGYPTIRFYKGAGTEDTQDYLAEGPHTQEPDEIISWVERRLEEGVEGRHGGEAEDRQNDVNDSLGHDEL